MNDDWTPEVRDDPMPPEPDAAVLARVVGRGRQRLARRRAIFGAIAASVAVVLVGSGVAVAQHRDASPDIAVNPPTTIASAARVTERVADANGLHYRLFLGIPEVAISQTFTVVLQVDNNTGTVASLGSCAIAKTAITDGRSTWIAKTVPCTSSAFGLNPGDSFSWQSRAIAPDSPGEYSLTVQPMPGVELPAPILEPLSLRVTDPLPTPVFAPPTTNGASPDTVAGGPNPTNSVATPTDGPLGPERGDFSGTLTTSHATVAVGDGVDINLYIRNNTAHEIETSQITHPTSLGIACTSDLTADGFTKQRLEMDVNLWFLTGVSLPPGADAGPSSSVAWFRARDADVGTITCGALIVRTDDGSWTRGTIHSTGRLTNIPTVSFTVTPALVESPATTAPSIEAATTTTFVGP